MTLSVAILLLVCGFLVAGRLPLQFFPANDRDQFQIQIDLPAHYPLASTVAVMERVREIVERHDEVLESHWFAGEPAPRVFYNMLGNYEIPSFAGGFVRTRSPEATEVVLPRLQRELRESVPEALAIALPFEQGPPFDAPIEVRIVGPDLDVLRSLGDDVRRVLAQTEAVTYTRAKLLGGRPTSWQERDHALEELVATNTGERDAELLRYFVRRIQRQEFLVEPVAKELRGARMQTLED